MLLSMILIVLLYFVCNFAIFYLCNLLNSKKNNWILYTLTYVINLFFITLFLFKYINDTVFVIGFIIIISIEHYIIFKCSVFKSVLLSTSVIINLYSYYLLFNALIASIINKNVIDVILSNDLSFYSLSISLTICIVYIFLFIYIMPLFNIRILNDNRKSLIFCNVISLISVLYILHNITFIRDKNYYFSNIFYLKVSVFGIIMFISYFYYAIFYSKLQFYKVRSNQIEKNIVLLNKEGKNLFDVSNYDPMTGFYRKSPGLDIFKSRLIDKRGVFTVAFVDLDGLKYVNDNLGHEEGDIYINFVSDTLKRYCSEYSIIRYGGDEFLIILEGKTESEAIDKMNLIYNHINLCNEKNNKYNMSVSYGVYEVNSFNKFSYSEILDLVDEKMYKFKVERKKQRK